MATEIEISYDPEKRARCLAERGLDFDSAREVFASLVAEGVDSRVDYGEERRVTFGRLGERLCVVVWTPRGESRRIISMRNANDREQRRYLGQVAKAKAGPD